MNLTSPFVQNRTIATVAALLALCLSAGCGKDAHTEGAEPKSAQQAQDKKKAPAPARPAPVQVLPIPAGGVKLESKYSKIEIDERGSVRTLYFVRDTGQRVVESQMDVAHPEQLLVRYTRSMFTSYLLVPEQERVLIVGIGAGSMIRFLQHHDPTLDIEAVDIDPVIVEVAGSYFGTRPGKHVKLVAADGLAYIRDATQTYDVIYMDAFLKPSMSTDSTGVPLRMKTVDFYKQVQDKLTPAGAVVFNLNFHPDVQQDYDTIAEAFPSAHLFRVPGSGNYVVVATKQKTSAEAMRKNAQAAQPTFGDALSLAGFIPDLMPEGKIVR